MLSKYKKYKIYDIIFTAISFVMFIIVVFSDKELLNNSSLNWNNFILPNMKMCLYLIIFMTILCYEDLILRFIFIVKNENKAKWLKFICLTLFVFISLIITLFVLQNKFAMEKFTWITIIILFAILTTLLIIMTIKRPNSNAFIMENYSNEKDNLDN